MIEEVSAGAAVRGFNHALGLGLYILVIIWYFILGSKMFYSTLLLEGIDEEEV